MKRRFDEKTLQSFRDRVQHLQAEKARYEADGRSVMVELCSISIGAYAAVIARGY